MTMPIPTMSMKTVRRITARLAWRSFTSAPVVGSAHDRRRRLGNGVYEPPARPDQAAATEICIACTRRTDAASPRMIG